MLKKCFYCIAATEEPRLYEDCITFGVFYFPFKLLQMLYHLYWYYLIGLGRVFFITISLYKVLPTCWQGASAVAYGLYPQSQDIPATRHFGRSSYYIGIRTISNAITRSHLARSYSNIGQKHLDPPGRLHSALLPVKSGASYTKSLRGLYQETDSKVLST